MEDDIICYIFKLAHGLMLNDCLKELRRLNSRPFVYRTIQLYRMRGHFIVSVELAPCFKGKDEAIWVVTKDKLEAENAFISLQTS